MRILFYGDIVGEVGRIAVHLSLPRLVAKYGIDFVIANAENATHGKGLSERDYHFLIDSGCDCLTLGNHWHSKEQIDDYIDDADQLVRPLNLLNYSHGVGSASFDVNGIEVRVTNLLGVFAMEETVANPHGALASQLKDEDERCLHIVDYHGDSTSEKEIFGYCFDGKVSAIIGTHTHVQTADAKILEGGSAYISDVGMCGASNGVIGFEKNSVIRKIVQNEKSPFEIDRKAPMMINALVMDFDEASLRCVKVEALNQAVEDPR